MASRPRSDGYFHERITLALTPMVGGMVLVGSRNILFGCLAALGCLAGTVLSPDLDQPSLTRSEWLVLKLPLVGWLVGSIWVALWLPYALLFKHRGISHMPVLGTLTRIGYLALFGVPLLAYLGWLAPALENWPYLAWLVVGLIGADFGHWLRDFHGLQL